MSNRLAIHSIAAILFVMGATFSFVASLDHAGASDVMPVAAGHEPFLRFFYDPSSKSYFEIVDGRKEDFSRVGPGGVPGLRDGRDVGYGSIAEGPGATGEGPNWVEAAVMASERVFKGVRGRLAIVKTRETHEFLKDTFHPGTFTWIGLRFFCPPTKELQWEDKEVYSQGEPSFWDAQWNRSTYGVCDQTTWTYMPAAYSAFPDFRWIINGPVKRYYMFFVQYPTGHP